MESLSVALVLSTLPVVYIIMFLAVSVLVLICRLKQSRNMLSGKLWRLTAA